MVDDTDDDFEPDDIELDDEGGDDEGTGTAGQRASGEDTGEGDEEGDVSAERADASPEEDDGQQGSREGQAPVSRGSRRIQRLLRENRELKERNERSENERQEYQRQQHFARQRETYDQREARRAVMTPEERNSDDWLTWQQGINATVQGARTQFADEMDQAKFEAKAAINPLYAKWEERVERIFQDRKRAGMPMAQREVIMKYLIGEAAMKQAPSQSRKAKAEGRKRVQAAQVRPGSSRGDAATTRGRGSPDGVSRAEHNLRGVEI
jgi:hypothetical protein